MSSRSIAVFRTCLFCLLANAAGCTNGGSSIGGRAPGVRVSADPSTDYSKYHTYAFIPGELSADPSVVKVTSEQLDRRIEAALAPRLAAKGLRPATEQEPADFNVTYVATVRRDADIVKTGGRSGPGGYDEPGAIPSGAEWGVRDVEEGTLVLQFTDARTHMLAWRATVAADGVQGNRELDRALDAALTRYPPKK